MTAQRGEEEHFMKCSTCGESFDMRDLKAVLDHEHDEDLSSESWKVSGIKGNRDNNGGLHDNRREG